jgi:branched-chain amino acid transport system substrate-binding protein
MPMMPRRAALALGVTLLAGLAVPADAQQQPPIRIGAVLSTTGPASFLGDPQEKTLRHWVGEINRAGGVNGRQLEVVIYDDGGDPNRAQTFARRLIEQDRIVAMIGGSTTGTSMPLIPIFEDAEIPFISFAGAIEVIQPVRRYTFKTPHTDRMACEKIFDDLRRRNLTRIGLISGTGGFGASMRRQCMEVAPAFGMQIVADETYGPRDTDMTAQLTKIRGTQGVQAVVNADFGQGPAIVTRNYRQLGITLPLYQSHGVASRQFIELAGEAANGVRLPAAAMLVADKLPAGDPQQRVSLDYVQTYQRVFGQAPSTFGGHAYDGLLILVDAMRRAGNFDPKRIRDEIERTRGLVGTAGIFNMSPTDHMGLDLAAFKMIEIRNGDWALVE